MRHKFGILFIIILILVMSILGLLYYSNLDVNSYYKDESSEEIQENYEKTYLRAQVYSGDLENNFKTIGHVISEEEEEYVDSYSIEWDTYKSIKFNKNIGSEVKKGDIIYSLKNKPYYATYDGRIANIVTDYDNKTTTLYVLNYDKLYIELDYPSEKLNLLNYSSPILFKLNSSESDLINSSESDFKYKAQLYSIGYKVDDQGMVKLKIKSSEKILPGTKISVLIKLPKKQSSLYTLKEMVKKSGDEYYVEVEDKNSKIEKRTIKIGELFKIEEDGVVTEYIEILEGVSENEKLITEIVSY